MSAKVPIFVDEKIALMKKKCLRGGRMLCGWKDILVMKDCPAGGRILCESKNALRMENCTAVEGMPCGWRMPC